MKNKLRKPTVPNKYGLKRSDITRLIISDRSKISEPLFFRNDGTNSWNIYKEVGKYEDNSFCLCICDDDKIVFYCSCYNNMCNYNFTEFYKWDEIDNIYDLEIQELLLTVLNELIDLGILRKGN